MTDFRINVVVDPSGAVSGTKVVDRRLVSVENRADRVRRGLARAFAVAGIGVGLAQSVRLLADFSQELSTVQAITRATGDEFDALQERAQQLGTNTRFSATQAAEGMTFLARAGFDAQEVLGTIDDTLQLAQAGALGLGEAADIASNVLTGFRLETDQASRVVDVLALAANSANTDVSQLGQALKFVAPIAAGVGVELEETTAAIAALSNAGLQASLAGTGLRRILSELESPAAKTQAIFRDLSISSDDVRVSQVGLTQALRTLADAGVDTGLALELFGDRGGPAFEVLRSSIPDVERMTESLGNADGTAARIAETMDDNLNGALLAVTSAFQGFVLALGDTGGTDNLEVGLRGLAEALRFLATNVDDVVNAVTLLGVGFLAIKIAPFVAGLSAAAASSLKLQVALIRGTAVRLGSAQAAAQEAQAAAASARATLFETEVKLANTQATLANAVATTGGTEASIIHAAITKQVAAQKAASALASDALTAANVKATIAMRAATVASRALNASLALNPFLLVIIGAAATVVALRKVNGLFKEVDEANRTFERGQLSALSSHAAVTQQIADLNVRITEYRKLIAQDIDAGKIANPATVRALERLEGQLAKLTGAQSLLAQGTKRAQAAAQEQKRALDAVNDSFDDAIAKLEEEVRLLGLSSQERAIQAELLRTIASIEKEGAGVSDEQRERLEAFIRSNAALRTRTELLDGIRGPAEEFNSKLRAAAELERQGIINGEQLRAIVKGLKEEFQGFEEPAGVPIPDPGGGPSTGGGAPEAAGGSDILGGIRDRTAAFLEQAKAIVDVNRGLAEETRLSGLSASERAIEVRALAIENELRRKGVELQPEEQAALRTKLEGLAADERRAALLDEIRGPEEEFAQRKADLLVLLNEEILKADEYAEALARVNEEQRKFNEEAGNIPTGPLTEYQKTVMAFKDVARAGFGQAADAVVEFAATGEGNFKDFADSFLEQAKRILAQRALLALLDAFTGGGASSGESFLGVFKARQEGGPVNPSETFLVGEEGPELFTPPGSGNIIPAGETAAALSSGQATTVNVTTSPPEVTINNIEDPEQTFDDLETPRGERIVMNHLRKNRRETRELTGL